MLFVLTLALCLAKELKGQTTYEQAEAIKMIKLELAFDNEWSTYLLNSFGCRPPQKGAVAEVIMKEDCTRPKNVDMHQKNKARELAKKVFGLEDRSPAVNEEKK